jgi:uncharacterized membrane protein
MTLDILEDRPEERDYALDRVIMLSDGVFAIAITLLALELRPPGNWDHALGSLLGLMWRPAAAFLVSFLIIAFFWIAHRRMFGRFRTADMPLTVLNFVMLGLITLAPVATNLAWEGGPRGGGFVVYWAMFTLLGLTNAAIWAYAAFLKPSLFHRPPSRGVAGLTLAMLMVMPLTMPLFGLVTSGAFGIWVIAPVLVLVFALRLLRSRMKSVLDAEGAP